MRFSFLTACTNSTILSELGFPLTVKEILQPTAEVILPVYEGFVEYLVGKQQNKAAELLYLLLLFSPHLFLFARRVSQGLRKRQRMERNGASPVSCFSLPMSLLQRLMQTKKISGDSPSRHFKSGLLQGAFKASIYLIKPHEDTTNIYTLQAHVSCRHC